ncbi:WD repeat and coiled coil containing [Phyllostomus discolor]|uniref:WD repeat and coiled-coil-containing protein n=1 Tax=Phyllostomus discolor TaxID=89673 RepID=A0A6J2M2T8_9CHIR|nr:WD repeat and coiled-coil-containing protein isoform X1 [Phyllostomus discolor]XP_035883599.1 WD repeat and coiled-coil-containing protein isoform X1 [Phyllostomus discolor]XP_035883600.1 WD repeat and coiled-coil-containing protein isoform X1 [Phyllostomus discolor]XP_035883601.1 WD repeat and coiled-coil-containing protein isoform X1 [Phyllostomus discolor]XP_035883602.1 WD repeat and coiled-coil-containing protein isoform X1 [Phyllostomus discolor]XP_035883603.1 WD repeat and coiled-coil
MELGKGRLLRTGLNALYQAVHPVHGLVWTNGNQVVLTDVQLQGGEAKFGDSEVIGQFEHVYGVSWAPLGAADMPPLLAVQHTQHVTVWQLCPSTVGTGKWLMSETCEIRESLPVLPQGCVWHPQSAVLTVLTAQDVSVFHDVHRDSSRVRADSSIQGPVHCACWTQDGQRLVVAAGSSLHSYIWDSAQKTLRRCSSCSVLDVGSSVRSVRATGDSQVAVATELPLGQLCGLHASEALDGPPPREDACPTDDTVIDDVFPVDKGAVPSQTDLDTSASPFSPSSSAPLDLTHIVFNRSKSEGNAPICVRKKDYLTGTGLDSSHLVLVTFEKEVAQTRRVPIPGILAPDLIAFSIKAQVVAVASNTCNIIFIYSVISSFMPNIEQIQLESSERPKGICFLTDKLLLILVGKQKSNDPTFPPPSKSDEYVIHLIVREVVLEEKFPITQSGNQSGYSTFSSLLNKAEGRQLMESLSPDICPPNRGLLLTADSRGRGGRPGSALIEEIRSPPSSAGDGSVALGTPDTGPANESETLPRPSNAPDHTSTPAPLNAPQRKNLQREEETYRPSKELEVLSRKLVEVQQCLTELTAFLHNGKKSSPVYPLSRDLPYVHIFYQKPYCVGPVVETRDMLLCNGKLRLSTIQQTFGLSLVEMLHGSHWILLCADSEGFIPLTFTAAQEVIVRDGSSRSDVFRDSLSQSLDSGPCLDVCRDLQAQSLDSTGYSDHLGSTA